MILRALLLVLLVVTPAPAQDLTGYGLRLRENSANGSNVIRTLPPASIVSDRTCQLVDTATPYNSCVVYSTESAIEADVDLQDLQGAVTDGQIPAAITRDSEVNVQGTANEITSSGSGVAPTLSIASTFRITGKTATAPIKTGTSPPGTCTVGDFFFDTDATAGDNVAVCTATNTWTYIDGTGASGFITDVFNCSSGDCQTLVADASDSLDMTAGASSAPCKSGTSAPGTCSVGQCFFDTDASPAGEQLFFCTATDTWTKVGDGGGAGSGYATIEDEGSPLAQETVLNFTGAGITCTAETGETECEVPGGSSITSAAARAYNNAAISISHSTVTALTFNSERFDTNSLHDTGSNTSRLTAPVTGVYMISGSVQFASNATGIRAAFIRLNGSTNIATQILPVASSTDIFTFGVQTIYQLTAGDYVELTVFQNSGGSLNVNSDGNRSPEFAMALFAGQ
jgi:hypothetical protein